MSIVLRTEEEIEASCTECPVFLIQELVNAHEDPAEEFEQWQTVAGAWFTPGEAEEHAKSISYRLGKWRIWPVGARGNLKTLLEAHTVESVTA